MYARETLPTHSMGQEEHYLLQATRNDDTGVTPDAWCFLLETLRVLSGVIGLMHLLGGHNSPKIYEAERSGRGPHPMSQNARMFTDKYTPFASSDDECKAHDMAKYYISRQPVIPANF